MNIDFVEFRQLREVGVFSYLIYSLAKSHFNEWDVLRPGWPCFRFQKKLGPSEEIPSVVVNNAKT